MGKYFLCVFILFVVACETGSKADHVRCDSYRPACYLGGNLQCHRNADGCESCTCVTADNPHFNEYQPSK